jgi:hypothetical protein
VPSSVRAATEHYRADNDLAAQFLAYADIKPGTAPLRYPRRVSQKRTTLGATITMAYAAYLHAVDRPGVIATEPVAGLLYDAGIGLPRQLEGGAV